MSWQTQFAKAMKQIDWCVNLAKKYVLPWWGATEAEFPTPIPPSVGALYSAHEGATTWTYQGKRIFAPARFVLTNYPECGLKNLTAKKGDDEVTRLNVHPYDIRSHFWAAQHAFWEGRDYVNPRLAQYGFATFDDLAIYDQLSLLLLQRAVGLGCTRGLLRKASKESGVTPLRPIYFAEQWLKRPGANTTPFDGSQDTEVVRLRFAWTTRMILRANEAGIGDLPMDLKPPASRPSNIVPMPKDFRTNMKAYSREARRQGPMPTGSWPA